jgi:hypothetical protein
MLTADHALRAAAACAVLVAGCANNAANCSAPSSGKFSVTLQYAQTVTVALQCDTSLGEAGIGEGGDGASEAGVGDAGVRDASLGDASAGDGGASDGSAADAGVSAGSVDDAGACGARPHPFDGATLEVSVSGSSATITSSLGSFSCAATAPRAAPSSQPDGSTLPGTGCYLLLECDAPTLGDAGPAQLQVQLLTQASTDALVLVRSIGPDCCSDEYNGTWH